MQRFTCARVLHVRNMLQSRRWQTTRAASTAEDKPIIPEKPTWSVHELLSSYPRPSISSATLKKLHELSALIPPEEGSEEHTRMRRELEELVRLVEAVKLVDTSESSEIVAGSASEDLVQRIPDGRIWPEGKGMVLSSNSRAVEFEDKEIESGTELLKHAALTKNGLYVVETDRRKG